MTPIGFYWIFDNVNRLTKKFDEQQKIKELNSKILHEIFVPSKNKNPINITNLDGLEDIDGKKVNSERFLGNWSLIFYGYIQCPDICPLTITRLKKLSTYIDGLQYIFVAFNSDSTKVKDLKSYIDYFSVPIIGVIGHEKGNRKLADQIGASFNIDSNSSIEHSTAVFLIGPDGVKRGDILRLDKTEEVANLLKKIMKVEQDLKNE